MDRMTSWREIEGEGEGEGERERLSVLQTEAYRDI